MLLSSLHALLDRDSTWLYASAALIALLALLVVVGPRYGLVPLPAPPASQRNAASAEEEGFVIPWTASLYDGGTSPYDAPESQSGASSALYADFNDARWTSRSGVTIGHGGDKLADVATLGGLPECRAACSARDDDAKGGSAAKRCVAAAYNSNSGVCSLYATVGEPVEAPGSAVLLRRDVTPFRDLPMTALQTSEPLAGTASVTGVDACRQRCADTSDCVAATFHSRARRCNMFRSVRGLVTPTDPDAHSIVRVS